MADDAAAVREISCQGDRQSGDLSPTIGRLGEKTKKMRQAQVTEKQKMVHQILGIVRHQSIFLLPIAI